MLSGRNVPGPLRPSGVPVPVRDWKALAEPPRRSEGVEARNGLPRPCYRSGCRTISGRSSIRIRSCFARAHSITAGTATFAPIAEAQSKRRGFPAQPYAGNYGAADGPAQIDSKRFENCLELYRASAQVRRRNRERYVREGSMLRAPGLENETTRPALPEAGGERRGLGRDRDPAKAR